MRRALIIFFLVFDAPFSPSAPAAAPSAKKTKTPSRSIVGLWDTGWVLSEPIGFQRRPSESGDTITWGKSWGKDKEEVIKAVLTCQYRDDEFSAGYYKVHQQGSHYGYRTWDFVSSTVDANDRTYQVDIERTGDGRPRRCISLKYIDNSDRSRPSLQEYFLVRMTLKPAERKPAETPSMAAPVEMESPKGVPLLR